MIVKIEGRTGLTPRDFIEVLARAGGKVLKLSEDHAVIVKDGKIALAVSCEMIEDGLTNVELYVEDASLLESIVQMFDELEFEVEKVEA